MERNLRFGLQFATIEKVYEITFVSKNFLGLAMRRQLQPFISAVFFSLVFGVLSGCPSSKPTDETGETKPPQEDLGGPLPGEPKVAYRPWTEIVAGIESSSGAVTAVMFWNEDNEFNDDEINEFVRMAKIFRDDKVTFMTVNVNSGFNDTEDREARMAAVRKYVIQHEANFQHFLSVVPEFELLMSTGSVRYPSIFLFDKTGKLRHTVSVSLDKKKDNPLPIRQAVIPKVKKLLEEKTAAVTKETDTEQPSSQKSDSEKNPAPKPSVAKGEVKLQTLDWEKTQEIVAQHRGQVVVLDLWSNHCLPCMQEFPNLVKLQATYPEKVKCISFNMDYQGNGEPEENRELVMEFLTSQNAVLTNVMSAVADEKLYEKLNLGSLPAIYVYDQDGKVAKRFDANSAGEFTYEKDVIPLVKELLTAK